MAGVSKSKQIRRQQLEARRTARGQAGPKAVVAPETNSSRNNHDDGDSVDSVDSDGHLMPGNPSIPMIDGAEPEHVPHIDIGRVTTQDDPNDCPVAKNLDPLPPGEHIDLMDVDPHPPSRACGHLLSDPCCDECHPPVVLARSPKRVTSETQTDIGGVGRQFDFLWDTFVYIMQVRAAHAPAPSPSPANSASGVASAQMRPLE